MNLSRLIFLLAPLGFASTAIAFNPSQQPSETNRVPGNVMLALSVEFPTGLQVSYTDQYYTAATLYEGYFDNRKCYTYSTANEAFSPSSAVSATGTCGNTATEWSGNLLNWLTMSNLDQFRSVMTGGTRDSFSSMNATHPGDTTNRTVLIRSFSDRNSYNPIKRLRTTDPVPSAYRTVETHVRSGGYGSKMLVATRGDRFVDWTNAERQATCANSPMPNATSWCFNIRVEVCRTVTGVPLEANCKASYSGVPKPEGLIQEYANTLRFGAAGYFKEDGNTRQGAPIRSAMKSVGQNARTSSGTAIANANKEWNETTGVMIANPDPTDATASGVANSGLMNYLNKFGFASGYKGNDPLSELYYTSLRYLRGAGLPGEYTSSTTAAGLDGFPSVTANISAGQSRDPVINTCQKNFILTIGDIYTHCDGNLPGSALGVNATCGTFRPTDTAVNVDTWWQNIRGAEGITANPGWRGGSSNGTPYIAALAAWANTNDIRPEAAMPGNQHVSSYFIDVLENNNGQSAADAVSNPAVTQYWLGAKYGGFDRTKATMATLNTTDGRAAWDANNDGIPDNWFAGSTPALLRASLKSAFSKIDSEAAAGSASSAAVTSTRQTSTSQVIYAGYDPKDWSGTLRACTPTQTAEQCRTSPTWEASRWFNASLVGATSALTPTNRKILTSWRDTNGFSKMRFQWAQLNTAQQASLNINEQNNADLLGEDRLNYLRGDRAGEPSGLFRKRSDNLLGDIVNAGVTFVGGSGPAYTGAKFPGHQAYRTTTRNRPPVVYVGANDGMLHAFSGATGKELFAYVPGSVFVNLPGLTRTQFQHRYFVDSTPMVGDFERSSGTWGTALVGGLGAGGRAIYALDISSQSSFETASEATLASELPMWEFTNVQDADLGYTYNEPVIDPITGAYRQIAKVADANEANGVWRVVMGNGYGSTGGASNAARAVLFMLNVADGAVSTKLIADSATNANGLSTPAPVDTDRDGLIDTVYAGDLEGNLHKFQFSQLQGANFVLAASGTTGAQWRYLGKVYATGQPITTAPTATPSTRTSGWLVSFGTGKLNEATDYGLTTATGFYTVLDNAPSSSLTVASTDIVNIPFTNVNVGINNLAARTWTTPNLTGKKGWRMAFSGGERVLSNATLPPDTGTVLFATTTPAGDVCDPVNSGYLMAVSLESGAVGDIVIEGSVVGGASIYSSGVVKVSNTFTNTRNNQAIVCNQDGCKPGGGSGGGGLAPDGTPLEEFCQKAANAGNPACEIILRNRSAPGGRYTWRELLTK
jgi:type IV pilus assembly protein PilY1